MHYIYLEEVDEYNEIDWRFFIYYNRINNEYILNCARRMTRTQNYYRSFYLRFKSMHQLCYYIFHLTGSFYGNGPTRNSQPTFNYTINNSSIINLSNFGSFDRLLDLHFKKENYETELFGFDKKMMTKKYLRSALHIIRDISSYQ